MSSLMFYCLQLSISAIFEKRLTDGRTDRRTDGRTDKASYRDAWTHLKRGVGEEKGGKGKRKNERGVELMRKYENPLLALEFNTNVMNR